MTAAQTAIYTAMFGGYDLLLDPRELTEGVDYICFTDDESLSSDGWEIRTPRINDDLPPNLKNRRIKMLPHEYIDEYDYSIYIDGNIQIRSDISEYTERYRDVPLAAPTHRRRDCAYDEAAELLRRGKGDEAAIREQMAAYEADGFPRDFGLTANSFLLRRHGDPQVQRAMEEWWRQLQLYSSRDQLSLQYVLWKEGIEYQEISSGPRFDWDTFRMQPHLPPEQWKRPFMRAWITTRARYDQNPLYAVPYYGVKGLRRLSEDGLRSTIHRAFRLAVAPDTREDILELGDRLGLVGPDAIYEPSYYEQRRFDPYRGESHRIAEVLDELFEPDSVIDFGCAIGAYLEPFHERGAQIRGVEANSAAFEHAVVPSSVLTRHDLRRPFEVDRQYDLVISIEVAEHIPQCYVDTYLDTLAGAGSNIVMSAAPPGQGGTHHVNEQPPEFWVSRMAERGYRLDSELVAAIREKTEGRLEAFKHVPQNVLVFLPEE